MKKIIAVDIDDVLAESAAVFVEYSNQHWGTNLTINDYDENWMKIWAVDHEVASIRATEYLTSGALSKYNHKPDSVEILRKLKNDYNLVLVTSRNLNLLDETVAWVKCIYGDIFSKDDIHFAGIWDSVVKGDTKFNDAVKLTKGDYLSKLKADYLIDDQIKHCVDAASRGIKSFLFGNYSWNQLKKLPQRVTRVNDWSEVLSKLNEVGDGFK